MSLKCDSCLRSFPTAVNLFEHIQQSCLAFYKSHPLSWSKILSSLTPNEEPPNASHNSRRKASIGSSRVSTPSPSSSGSRETPPLPTQTRVQKPVNTNNNAVASSKPNAPLICKCEASFRSREEFKEHLKTCLPGKEPPFCIMFRAQEPEAGKALENVHMTVSDYFYGSITGKIVKLKKISRRCNCYSCGKTLRNNIRFMSHLRHKVFNEWEKKETNNALNICQHCYRQYDSPFLLQCHLENVHASVPAACSCRICELHFTSERTFLFHMKDKHVRNETPYVCKVCLYRSSFYNDVIKHFRDEHVDTTAMMCPFCLAVAHNSSALLKHVIQHIKKGADCSRCRLKFINAKERAVHNQFDHCSSSIRSKLKKHNDLSKCQVYVRVTSFQTTQRQQLLQNANNPAITPPIAATTQAKPAELTRRLPPKRSRQGPETASESPPFKKSFIAQTRSQLPNYLCPLKRSAKIKRVRIPGNATISVSSHRCAECRESLSIWNNSFVDHFKSTFECKWCVFATCCESAANKHVLREHADADLREQLLGKSEKTKTAIETVSLEDDDDDVTMLEPDVKAEQNDQRDNSAVSTPLPPQLEVMEDDASKPNSSKTKEGKTILQPKPRRKQSNPMRIADGVLKSPKRVQRERKVQTKSFEKEKGIQTSDKEFQNIEVDSGEKSVIVQKEFIRPGIKIQNKPKPPPKHRKVLAPEGYFPDIDDDAGWAKYFQEFEGTSSNPVNNGGLQPLHPKIVSNQKKTEISHGSTEKGNFLLPAASVSQPDQNSRNVSQVQPVSAAKAPLPGVTLASSKTKTRPVYQFQFVPKAKPLIKPSVTPQPITCLFNEAQNVINRVPRTPVDLRCLEVTHSSLLIQWDAPPNCPVTEYKVVFQGCGAPTVQLLPPEQTLVRLVGLKSDTMYVVRVYTLNRKSVSQYAFLYQKTNALRSKSDQHQAPADDDVVLVLDDNEPVPKSLPPPLSKAPVLNSLSMSAVKPSMPSMSHAVTRVTNSKTSNGPGGNSQINDTKKVNAESHVFITQDEQLLHCPSSETLSETGQPVLVVQPEAPEDDSKTSSISLPSEGITGPAIDHGQGGTGTTDLSKINGKKHLNKEKNEKMILLNELLAGLNRKKIGGQKSKIAKAKPTAAAKPLSSDALFLPVSSSDKNAASVVQTIILTPIKIAKGENAAHDCHNTTVVASVKVPSTASVKNDEEKPDDASFHAPNLSKVKTKMSLENFDDKEQKADAAETENSAAINEINTNIAGKEYDKNVDATMVGGDACKSDVMTDAKIAGDAVKIGSEENKDHTARNTSIEALPSSEQESFEKVSIILTDSSLVTFQSSSNEVDNIVETYETLNTEPNASEPSHVTSMKDSEQSDFSTILDGNEASFLTKRLTVTLTEEEVTLHQSDAATKPLSCTKPVEHDTVRKETDSITLTEEEVTVHQSDAATKPSSCTKPVEHDTVRKETDSITAAPTEDASYPSMVKRDEDPSHMAEQNCEPGKTVDITEPKISPTPDKENESPNMIMPNVEEKSNSDSTDIIPESSVGETQLLDRPASTEECEMEVNIVNVVSLCDSQGIASDTGFQLKDQKTSQKMGETDVEGLGLSHLEEDKLHVDEAACQLRAGLSGTVVSADSTELCLTNSQTDKSDTVSNPKTSNVAIEDMREDFAPIDIELLLSESQPLNEETRMPALSSSCANQTRVKNTDMLSTDENASLVKASNLGLPPSPSPPSNEMMVTIVNKLPICEEIESDSSAKLDVVLQQCNDIGTIHTDHLKSADVVITGDGCESEDKDSMLFVDGKQKDDSMTYPENTAADIDMHEAQIGNATDKEHLNLGSTLLSSGDSVYVDGPTLDDIKNIMEEDLSWL